MPLVSVVIPSYNVERYVGGAIESVLNQSFSDFEVLAVDDGSTDQTAQVVRSYKDRRVNLVQQVNRGLAGARNAGIRAARGTYIAFLDADDRFHSEKLARHVEHLNSRLDVGVSFSQSLFINESGQNMHYRQAPKLINISARDVFLRNPVGNGSAPVIRRRVFQDIAFKSPLAGSDETWFFDESFRRSEDIECWMRIALFSYWKFEGIGLPLTYYRVNSGGLSADLKRQSESWEQMVDKLSSLAPYFMARHKLAARGYQWRYLARRAIRNGQHGHGLALACRAVDLHPGMLLEEPGRTCSTFAAALVGLMLPERLFRHVEACGMRMAQHSLRHSPPAEPT